MEDNWVRRKKNTKQRIKVNSVLRDIDEKYNWNTNIKKNLEAVNNIFTKSYINNFLLNEKKNQNREMCKTK